MGTVIHPRCIAALLGALCAPLAAQTLEGAPDGTPAPRSAGAASAAAGPALARRLQGLPRDTQRAGTPAWTGLSVVELPADNGPLPGRRHHAISIPFDGARSAARSLGIDATECALQLRMPARMAREPVAGARLTVDVQAQVRLACRM